MGVVVVFFVFAVTHATIPRDHFIKAGTLHKKPSHLQFLPPSQPSIL